jgi:hypothetical protein
MTIRTTAQEQSWDGRSDMLILRPTPQNRTVTKGYRKGVYEWVRKSIEVTWFRAFKCGAGALARVGTDVPSVRSSEARHGFGG